MTELARDPKKRVVLFHRDFQRFTGGHLKVWNYFNHIIVSKSHEPRIAFTAGSKWDATNPWFYSQEYVTEWKPETADVLFLAGADWKSVTSATLARYQKPIINLIQHPRHADPKDEVYTFLTNRAVRICVSEQVAAAIKATGKVNGPVFVLPNGIALDDIPKRTSAGERTTDILIGGLKAPGLATKIERELSTRDLKVELLIESLPRSDYLQRLNNARIAVTLPRPSEGFYLPAIEAMAAGAVVVCPDCVGNRDFCHDGVNCFRPDYEVDAIIAAIYRTLGLAPDEANKMRKQADAMVRVHSLARERQSFLEILERVDDVWKE